MIATRVRKRSGAMLGNLFLPPLLLLTLVNSAHAFAITANVTVHEETEEKKFILIDEGDSIEITCEDFNGNHHWSMPDNGDVLGFTKEDQLDRIVTSEGHDPAEQKLTISKAKVTDTGSYGCKYEEQIKSSVYVFVRGPHFFLKSSIHGFQVKEDENFVIPCRSTWPPLEEEGTVELYAEHELWKEASKYYDPKIGFEVTPKQMLKKINNGLGFQCKFNKETVNYFVQTKQDAHEEDFELFIRNETEFPHVGGELHYFCSLVSKEAGNFENTMIHRINADCPRCREDHGPGKREDMRYKMHHLQDQLSNITTVYNLTLQDSGTYSCQWFMEKGDEGFVLMKEVSKTFTVSPTIEQIKLMNYTLQDSTRHIEIDEGQELKIFASFKAFPNDASLYSSKWKRLFTRAQKGDSESEVIINDGQKSITSEKKGDETVDTLIVPKATIDLSGKYALEVSVNQKATRRVEWDVRVRAKKIVPRIEIASQDKWILFDQSYYNVGSALRVICYVEGFPKPEVHLMQRKLDPITDWEGVEGANPIEGTYSKGYTLNVTANEDSEYKCEGRRKGQPSVSESKQVRVTDSATDVAIAWHKPDNALSEGEDKDQIYEGDRIELECIVPKTDQVTMEWLFEKEKTNFPETTTVASHSKHLIATIEAASSAHSGDYTCVVRDEKNHAMNFTRTLEVTKTVKPFLRGASIETNLVVKYEEARDLTCPMEGTPEPSYKWLKDGVEVTDQISKNGQQLHLPRVGKQDEGSYVCQATNRAGTTELEYALKVKGAPKTLSGGSIALIIISFIVLFACLFAAGALYWRQRKKSKEQARSLQVLYEQLMRGDNGDAPPLPIHGKMTMDMRVRRTAYDNKYEVDMKNLVLLGPLGSGQFGSVHKGRLSRGSPVSDSVAYRGPSLTVAVKSPRNGNNPEDQKALIDELKILIAIDNVEETKHPNVLSLVGAVTKNMKDGQLYVIFEMCENGDLKTFLQRYKNELKDKFLNEVVENKEPATSNDDYLVPNNQATVKYTSQGDPSYHADQERDRLLGDPKALSTSDLTSFAMQIASGMDFLSGVSCIHRDLAARNCLLNSNKVVKIADFGMAKNEDKGYYRMNKTNVMVPYRWMAPESMEDHTFNVESDVWSYGIVLYEIFTLGSQPYPGIPNNNLHEHLKSGQRNPRPDLCHPDIYNIMLQTWDKDPNRRPTFAQCSQYMRDQLRLINPEMLESADAEIDRNATLIAQFDQFRGPRATAILEEHELAALLAGHTADVDNEENGERIYIKELRR